MKDFFSEKLSLSKTICIFFLIMIISGVMGFLYEILFYRIDLGYFTNRGSTFGPWIPIYAFGGLFITLFTYHLKKYPILVLVVNIIVTGVLEFITGYILNHIFNIRLWDYNKEIWNFGNIGGYICLRSVLLFGIASLLLIYFIIPNLIKIVKKRDLSTFSYVLFAIFLIDIILYKIMV